MSSDDSSSKTMVWKASDTSTIVNTLALVSSGSFSSIVGIVYFGLLIALLMVWLGSMHIRSLPFGFSFTRMLESQSVGCVTGLMMHTHTDRLLDQSSYNPTSHKATTIRTLTRRAQLDYDSPDSLTDEIKYLDNVFNKNNYKQDFIRHNTSAETPNQTLRTLMRHLSLLQTYLTSKGLLKLSHESYNPTTSALLTNLSLLYDSY